MTALRCVEVLEINTSTAGLGAITDKEFPIQGHTIIVETADLSYAPKARFNSKSDSRFPLVPGLRVHVKAGFTKLLITAEQASYTAANIRILVLGDDCEGDLPGGRVHGAQLEGAPLEGLGEYPVIVGGKDTNGEGRIVKTDTSGYVFTRAKGMTSSNRGDAMGAGSGSAMRLDDDSEFIPIVLPYEFDADSNVYSRPRLLKTLKTLTQNALADAGAANGAVWTPAAGKKFRLRGVRCRASIAGRYRLLDSASVVAYFYLPANTWVDVLMFEQNGYLSAAANNVLNLQNHSGGGAADVDAIAWGNEE